MEYTFGLIGSGNMGGAIAHAVSQTTKAGILTTRSGPRAWQRSWVLPTAPTKWSPKTANTSFSA